MTRGSTRRRARRFVPTARASGSGASPRPMPRRRRSSSSTGRGGSRSASSTARGSTGPSSIARSRSSFARCWRRRFGPEAAAISGAARRALRRRRPAPAAIVPPSASATARPIRRPSAARAPWSVAASPVTRGAGRFFAALGYRISTPLGSGSIQQGAAGEAGAHLGRAVELALGAALETRASDSTGAGTVSLFDLPIDVEARWVWRGRRPSRFSRLSWGGGGFAAVHLLVGHGDRLDGRATDVLRSRGRRRRRGARARRARAGHRRRSAPLHRASAPEHDLLGAGDSGSRSSAPRVGLGLSLVFPSL